MKNYQFYHIYPLGMLNKLSANWKTYDRTIHSLHPGENIRYMNRFIDHLKKLHINGVYVGPVFESVYHGYDTVDYTRLIRDLDPMKISELSSGDIMLPGWTSSWIAFSTM